MFGAGRNGRISWRQFLHLLGQRFDLLGQLIDLIKQRQKGCFDSGCHFGFEFRRYPAHASIGAENRDPSPDQFEKSLHRLVNAYSVTKLERRPLTRINTVKARPLQTGLGLFNPKSSDSGYG